MNAPRLARFVARRTLQAVPVVAVIALSMFGIGALLFLLMGGLFTAVGLPEVDVAEGPVPPVVDLEEVVVALCSLG